MENANNELRIKIINLLEQNGIKFTENKNFYLKNLNFETVDFRDDNGNIKILWDDNFSLKILGGKAVLETSYSNQKINDEWLKRLNIMIKIRDIINWELNGSTIEQ